MILFAQVTTCMLLVTGSDPFVESRIHPLSSRVFSPGDVNSDGRMDLVVTGFETWSAWLGDGALGFALGPTSYPAVSDLVALDANHDSKLDVVTSAPSGLRVHHGDGTGGFALGNTLGPASNWLVAADVNGDGLNDVVARRTSTWEIITHLGALPTLSSAAIVSPGMFGSDQAIADLDLDGFLDVVDGFGTTLSTLLGDGTGAFPTPVATVSVSDIRSTTFGDFDLDGKVDALVCTKAPGLTELWAGLGDGSFSAVASYGAGFSRSRAVDLDLDGDLDVLGLSQSNQIRYDLLIAPATFAAPELVSGFHPIEPPPAGFGAVDLDADGRNELVICGASTIVYRGASRDLFEGPKWFVSLPAPPIPWKPSSLIHPADIDDDGHDDVLWIPVSPTLTPSELRFERGDGQGGFATASVLSIGTPYGTSLELADVDQDGDLDATAAIAIGMNGAISNFVNDGDGGFVGGGTVAMPGPPLHSVDAFSYGDLNHDGDPDLAFHFKFYSPIWGGNFHTLSVVGGGPGSTFSGGSLIYGSDTTKSTHALEFADVDGDGFHDVLAANSNGLAIYRGQASGGISTVPLSLPGGGIFSVARVVDLDGNPWPDIVAFGSSSAPSGGLARWLGSANGFGAKQSTALSIGTVDGFADDVDGDGDLDVVARPLTVLLSDSAGGLTESAAYAPAGRLASSTLDADADGRRDYIVDGGGRIGILRHRGPDFFHHFGLGCDGSGGFVPRLALHGTPVTSEIVGVSLTEGLGGAIALVFFGTAETAAPITGNCTLLAAGLYPVPLAIALTGIAPGQGAFEFTATFPALPSGLSIVLQAFVVDPGVARGFAATNGATILVQ